MRSAIFDKERLDSRPRAFRTKAKSSSPYIGASKNLGGLWNFDDLLSGYNENGILPRILSPTLPDQFEDVQDSRRVPRISSGDSDSDVLVKQPDSIEHEDLPLSMLSPTLPTIFSNKIVQPTPTKTTESSILHSLLERTKRVRYINKLHDVKNPRFLVRFKFENKPTGLGIVIKNEDEKEKQKEKEKEQRQREKEQKDKADKGIDKSDKFDKVEKSDKPDPNDRKAELRRLNDDLQRKEEERQRPRILRNDSPPDYDSFVKTLSQEQKDEYKTSLFSKKNHWLKVAKETQAASEQEKDPFVSAIIRIDSLLLHMIAYDYDEKLKLVASILPSERYWMSMNSEITTTIGKVELLIKLRPSSKQLGLLVGVLTQAKCCILKRVNSILQRVIDLYRNKKKNTELHNKIIELQQQTIDNYETMMELSATAQNRISQSPASFSVAFPRCWRNRAPRNSNSLSFTPPTNNYYLPIGVYTDLHEISGVIYSCVKELAGVPESGYQMKSGKRR